MSLRIIVFGGIAIFVVMALIPFALKQGLKPDPRQRVRVIPDASPFDGETAYKHLETLTKFGPRPAGSEAARDARAYILRTLRALGARVEQVMTPTHSPSSNPELVHLVGIVPGARPDVILLGCNYGTYANADPPTLGANDGASAPAVLLELAATMGPQRGAMTVWLCFWEGHEGDDLDNPASATAAHLEAWDNDSRLSDVKAAIVLGAVGDCYLGIHRDPDAPKWLQDSVQSAFRNLGYSRHLVGATQFVQGPQHLLRRFDIPAITLTDMRFGGSVAQHRQLWHTAGDTPDKVCPASLQAVGDVIYHAMLSMDALLPRAE